MAEHTGEQGQFESRMASVEAAADSAVRSSRSLTRQMTKLRHAAATGAVRDLRRAMEEAVRAAETLHSSLVGLREGYDLDEAELMHSGAYTKELLAAAAAAGVDVFEEDDVLLCYPSVLRVAPQDSALEIDRRKQRDLRPSVVVARLAAAQRRGPRFPAGHFLESLRAGYDLAVAQQSVRGDAVIRLVDLHRILTLLPGAAAGYSKQEFARDLYLLDQSGVRVSKDGRRLRWAASSGTRQPGVLTTVGKSGQRQRYWGIAFEPDGRQR